MVVVLVDFGCEFCGLVAVVVVGFRCGSHWLAVDFGCESCGLVVVVVAVIGFWCGSCGLVVVVVVVIDFGCGGGLWLWWWLIFGCGFWLWKWILVVWLVDVFMGYYRFVWLWSLKERETKNKEKEMKNKKRIFKWIAKKYRTIDVGSVIKWGVKIDKVVF